eukprot:TRINITY_DN9699_c0_g1_i1.p1 TRINITY_DN9699_c0_g1~~TRINITY_DN9699_c0_g1_i1.p1  ORF type:complete len:447 (-),score=138.89 TRINITY_DN9699_c0_g1_i1:70-1410(-)
MARPTFAWARGFICALQRRQRTQVISMCTRTMKTCVLNAIGDNFTEDALNNAAKLLQQGELVAFPTETVYGLGANALDPAAVAKIYTAKGRPSDNPLIVHVSSLDMLRPLVAADAFPSEGSTAARVCSRFWPGPLTLLLPRREAAVPDQVTGGSSLVAVRMPAHPVALRLIDRAALPVAAPSANVSGRPSPTTAAHVLEDFDGRIPCVIDGGPTAVGLESTVLDLNRQPPLVLRPGGVTLEQLRELLPTVQLYDAHVHGTALADTPSTPGLKYRHYSPTAPVVLFELGTDATDSARTADMQARVLQRLRRELQSHRLVGVIRTHRTGACSYTVDGATSRTLPPDDIDDDDRTAAAAGTVSGSCSDVHEPTDGAPTVLIYELGDAAVPATVARGLFAALRRLDRQHVGVILLEGIDERDEGVAVLNRTRKCASEVSRPAAASAGHQS